jgi:hypothetical protein
MTPDTAVNVLTKLRTTLALIQELAYDGQNRDALHAFSRLTIIESKATAALALVPATLSGEAGDLTPPLG